MTALMTTEDEIRAPRTFKPKPKRTPRPREALSPQEAGERLGLTKMSVIRFLKNGTLPGFKLGHRWFIPTVAIDEMLAEAKPKSR